MPALRSGEFPFELVYAGAEMAELLENGVRLAREEIGGFFAVDPHDSPRDPDDGRMGRNVFQNDAAGADLGKFAHGDVPENLRPRTYDATLFDRRVTFMGLVFARSAEGHALIDNDPFLHDGGFSDHDAFAVIDKYSACDFRARMDLDPGKKLRRLAQHSREKLPPDLIEKRGGAMPGQGVHTRIGKKYFEFRSRRGVTFLCKGDVLAQSFKKHIFSR